MKIQCDACEGAAATVVCCADEAALCARCDVEIHAANKLASKHQRLPLEALSARLPRCDVCQLQKESPLGFKEMEWFADIDLFHDQAAPPKAGRTLAEVPELFGSQAATDAAYYRPSKAKKARIEVTDDEEDYLIVPDLG
ncbi:unnamed protein product [Urochloa humidicola]